MEASLAAETAHLVKERLPGVWALYLFGSQETGGSRPDSDVDLAFCLDEKPSASSVFALKTDLSSLLHADVDLVDLLRADTVTQAQVVSTGRRIQTASESQAAFFEVTVLSKYARLNEERREILNDIQKRGSVRG